MQYLSEYRDPEIIRALSRKIAATVTKPHTIMEICGGQTHNIMKYGIHRLLPEEVRLVHGPGCPVCVTPISKIDEALALAQEPGVTLCTFGDMMRVPGSQGDLQNCRAAGGRVRMVYSPADALQLALQHPDEEVVFFAVGFETTAPSVAWTIQEAARKKVRNYSVLLAHVLVPPAMEAILQDPQNQIRGFLAAGHVCTITGYQAYHPIAARHRIPIVVTGFEPVDLLQGLLICLEKLEAGEAGVVNQYARMVTGEGNPAARSCLAATFTEGTMTWRGLGELPASGYHLRPELERFDARRLLTRPPAPPPPNPCPAGDILTGKLRPDRCPFFGKSCHPGHPLGAPMVSTEGACAAWYRYQNPPSLNGSAHAIHP